MGLPAAVLWNALHVSFRTTQASMCAQIASRCNPAINCRHRPANSSADRTRGSITAVVCFAIAAMKRFRCGADHQITALWLFLGEKPHRQKSTGPTALPKMLPLLLQVKASATLKAHIASVNDASLFRR